MKRSGPCSPFRVQTSDRINLLDDEINERYLFHGTNPESAQSIARDLFKMDRAGSCAGSMFGRGIYLAENASKSDEYAKEGAGVYLGLCAMLLCRCAMGEVVTVSQPGDVQETVRAGGYDSVCGDRLAAAGTFREMVFFNEEAVYAEFIVIYTRVFE
ncbi:tank-1 [Symbiodinium sp. CCMP2456]|nr:tank-1 [Symbiodinium sp. CCMP2456]